MAVYAPDCPKKLDVFETFIKPKSYGRDVEQGPKISTSLVTTDEDDNDELHEMYGPSCWQGCGNNQGGFKMLM